MGRSWRWREDANGDAKAWLHWQNLNEDRHGNVQGLPWHGRAWLHVGNESAHVEWNVRSRACGASLSFERMGEKTVGGHFALPPVAIYFGLELRAKRLLSRAAAWVAKRSADLGAKGGHSGSEVSIRVHGWGVFWSVFADTSGWVNGRPRWRDGAWWPLDTLFGRERHSTIPAGELAVIIPMPEGGYPATITLERATRKRPRWFAHHVDRADVRLTTPIPVPGKGESSWDCDEDAIHGMSLHASSFEEAIAAVVQGALRDRVRHGGSLTWQPEAKKAGT